MGEHVRALSRHDPAIDAKRSNLEEYRRTLDPSHLVMLEGRKPMVFHLADLHYLDYQECLGVAQLPGLAADRAFRLGVVGIEGVPALCEDGRAWRPDHERTRDGETIKTITLRDMQAIFRHVAPRHILDIGGLLLERAEAERPGNGAGGAG